jgi:hypothetical protein
MEFGIQNAEFRSKKPGSKKQEAGTARQSAGHSGFLLPAS